MNFENQERPVPSEFAALRNQSIREMKTSNRSPKQGAKMGFSLKFSGFYLFIF